MSFPRTTVAKNHKLMNYTNTIMRSREVQLSRIIENSFPLQFLFRMYISAVVGKEASSLFNIPYQSTLGFLLSQEAFDRTQLSQTVEYKLKTHLYK